MDSDAIVSAKDVLTAVMQVRRIGRERVMQELESIEPDLTEFALAELSAIHHSLGETTITAKEVRRLSRQIEEMMLVLITSLRKARLRLWQETPAGDGDALAAGGGEGDSDVASTPPEQRLERSNPDDVNRTGSG